MSILWLLIPISLLGATGLAPFSWAERSGQYEDIAGAAQRILDNEDRRPETLSSQ
ncbi:MAG: cbb3-type cytochrome oxidase assembly protein CcoS [Altererythrobacter sp.]|nr:cbb3-type cytochrome oxidase assembly protein CcoS [Altererythrobacter sp.]OJU58802.1 MAG: cytochrome oxidase maturation protein, cbb3-type [Altererythrobacter sp. 66-12]